MSTIFWFIRKKSIYKSLAFKQLNASTSLKEEYISGKAQDFTKRINQAKPKHQDLRKIAAANWS
jgi:hypothetical protein